MTPTAAAAWLVLGILILVGCGAALFIAFAVVGVGNWSGPLLWIMVFIVPLAIAGYFALSFGRTELRFARAPAIRGIRTDSQDDGGEGGG